ncbi:MAG TPA: 6-phosphogluconolactonase [Thermoleophilaceae bacterium]|nr:6-phosphogluconolactonase [Thermoleophilaceae bacterium]
MSREIAVVADPAATAAERIADVVRRGGQIALAGGSTPRRAYELLATMDLDWSGCDLWLGDDRCVPPDHEHSNYKMVSEELVDRLPVCHRPVGWHRIRGELGPEAAADAFEAELRGSFAADAELPVFDLILLGIGPDAHTASLFPGDAALRERKRWAVGVETPGMAPLVPRVTLTLPVLDAAREVVFLIAGGDKAEAVARAFGDAPGVDAPASLVRPSKGTVAVLLDEAAGARLDVVG